MELCYSEDGKCEIDLGYAMNMLVALKKLPRKHGRHGNTEGTEKVRF
jgi:hypothetical protein